MKNIHIALDLDKTLAYHESGWGVEKVGPPILPMVEKVKEAKDRLDPDTNLLFDTLAQAIKQQQHHIQFLELSVKLLTLTLK